MCCGWGQSVSVYRSEIILCIGGVCGTGTGSHEGESGGGGSGAG